MKVENALNYVFEWQNKMAINLILKVIKSSKK